jgi:hypothetical protein
MATSIVIEIGQGTDGRWFVKINGLPTGGTFARCDGAKHHATRRLALWHAPPPPISALPAATWDGVDADTERTFGPADTTLDTALLGRTAHVKRRSFGRAVL